MIKPERKPIPISIYNGLAVYAGYRGNLSFDRLIKKAKKNTGLSDLGPDFNEKALKLLITSINEEAGLHAFGLLMIREKLVSQLENRLWAEHWFNRHPEILEQEVLPIVMVTGLQRTGTTKMQRLLSGQPGARALLSWEALYPAPVGDEKETRQRMARTKRNEMAVKWISPAFHAIHPIHTDQPEEDVLLLDLHFMSSSSEAILHVPSYAAWLNTQDQEGAYLYEKKLLKLLQWQRAGKFWVLKSPHHLHYLSVFIKVFPDSKIVWMHRALESCIPSFLSMLFYSRSIFANNVDQNMLKDHWLCNLEEMLNRGLRFRKRHMDKIIDVNYEDFMQSGSTVISGIIPHLHPGQEIPGIQKENATKINFVSNHRYQLSDWDLTPDKLSVRFAEYNKLLKNLGNSK